MAQLGVVIKRDGTVPFDEGLHPEHQAQILGYLLLEGHQLEKHPDTGLWKIANYTPPDIGS